MISSILARIAVPFYTGYSASKAGLLGLVRSLAAELAPEHVQVNAICPGWIDTDMAWSGLDAMPGTREESFTEAMKAVPLGRMGQPEDVAGTVAWLLSTGCPRRYRPGHRPKRRRVGRLTRARSRGSFGRDLVSETGRVCRGHDRVASVTLR